MEVLQRYVTKYGTKTETKSQTFVQILSIILESAEDDASPASAIQKLLIKSISERDITSQEVCHLLLGLSLHKCTRTFVKLYLYPNSSLKKIQRQKAGSSEEVAVTSTDIIDWYGKRGPELKDKTLLEIAKKFNWNGKTKRYESIQMFAHFFVSSQHILNI